MSYEDPAVGSPSHTRLCAHVDATSLGGADYVAPRQTITGAGASREAGAALRAQGIPAGRVCVIADRAVHSLGATEPLLQGLKDAGLTPVVFADLSPEPSTVELDEIATAAQKDVSVAVMGIGGGSAMDAAKLVALTLMNGGPVADYSGVVKPDHGVSPLALVPTTVGTGSEATRIAMVTNNGRKQITSCLGFVPLLAVLDPDLVADLPGPVVASTAMDALAHAIEALLSTNRNALTVGASARAAELILLNIHGGVTPNGRAARANLLLASHLAGLALNSGVVLGHSLAYLIANRTALSHGVTCAMSLPYCLAYNHDADTDLVRCVSTLLTQGRSDQITDAVDVVVQLIDDLEVPASLHAVGISNQEINPMVSECIDRYPRPNNPVPVEADRLRLLLEAMYAGDPAVFLSGKETGRTAW